jgi:hypothetical protein
MLNLITEIKVFRLDRSIPALKTLVSSFSTAINATWDSDNHLVTPGAIGARGKATTAAAQNELGFQTAFGSNGVVEMPKASVIELLSIWSLGMLGSLASWYGAIHLGVWVVSKISR